MSTSLLQEVSARKTESQRNITTFLIRQFSPKKISAEANYFEGVRQVSTVTPLHRQSHDTMSLCLNPPRSRIISIKSRFPVDHKHNLAKRLLNPSRPSQEKRHQIQDTANSVSEIKTSITQFHPSNRCYLLHPANDDPQPLPPSLASAPNLKYQQPRTPQPHQNHAQ